MLSYVRILDYFNIMYVLFHLLCLLSAVTGNFKSHRSSGSSI